MKSKYQQINDSTSWSMHCPQPFSLLLLSSKSTSTRTPAVLPIIYRDPCIIQRALLKMKVQCVMVVVLLVVLLAT
jgi:hypothetical protein